MAFMPFVTCGDPDLETTAAVITTLADRGVDLIEVGFPYSDPIADGPVIQASYTRALNRGVHVRDIFGTIQSLTSQKAVRKMPPLVAMVAYAIVFRNRPERFLEQCAKSGFAGLIVPDLPGDEAGELVRIAEAGGVDLVQLVSPTTPDERVDRILRAAHGFLYCISVAGTTGARDKLPAELEHQLGDLRGRTDLPLAVGFGISKPEQVGALRGMADGVIVGSAIVRMLEPLSEQGASRDDALARIGEFASGMLSATRGCG